MPACAVLLRVLRELSAFFAVILFLTAKFAKNDREVRKGTCGSFETGTPPDAVELRSTGQPRAAIPT